MSRYLGSKMILVENWEEYHRHWSSEENRVDDHGDHKDGGFGVGGAPDVSWRRWLIAALVEEEPFLFFVDSSVWWSFWRFQLVESKEDWKWWSLGFVGRDLVKKRRRHEDLKFGWKGAWQSWVSWLQRLKHALFIVKDEW